MFLGRADKPIAGLRLITLVHTLRLTLVVGAHTLDEANLLFIAGPTRLRRRVWEEDEDDDGRKEREGGHGDRHPLPAAQTVDLLYVVEAILSGSAECSELAHGELTPSKPLRQLLKPSMHCQQALTNGCSSLTYHCTVTWHQLRPQQ